MMLYISDIMNTNPTNYFKIISVKFVTNNKKIGGLRILCNTKDNTKNTCKIDWKEQSYNLTKLERTKGLSCIRNDGREKGRIMGQYIWKCVKENGIEFSRQLRRQSSNKDERFSLCSKNKKKDYYFHFYIFFSFFNLYVSYLPIQKQFAEYRN